MCCTKRREENRKRMGRVGKMLAGVVLGTHKMKGMEGWNGGLWWTRGREGTQKEREKV